MDGDLGSLLCDAAHSGDLSEVRRLVARGADVDSRGFQGRTALQLSILHPATLQFLLKNGASPHLLDHNGVLPLHEAAYEQSGESVAFLLAAPDIDVNAKTNLGFTPLHCLLNRGFTGIYINGENKKRALSCLIEAGADVDAVTNSGRSALDIALCRGLREPVKILLRAGAFKNLKTAVEYGRSPHNAAAFAVYDRVKAAGDWKAYARKHQSVLAGLVSKCAPLPDDAARLVVGFWTPPGGSYMC